MKETTVVNKWPGAYFRTEHVGILLFLQKRERERATSENYQLTCCTFV